MITNVQFPDRSLFVIGANIIQIFKDNLGTAFNIIKLCDDYEISYGEISYAYFIYALDWLFIIGMVRLTDKGELSLCA